MTTKDFRENKVQILIPLYNPTNMLNLQQAYSENAVVQNVATAHNESIIITIIRIVALALPVNISFFNPTCSLIRSNPPYQAY